MFCNLYMAYDALSPGMKELAESLILVHSGSMGYGGKGHDAQEFIEALTQLKVLPHVAQNTSGRRSAVPDSVAATDGYAISQQKRKLIEQGFGWPS